MLFVPRPHRPGRRGPHSEQSIRTMRITDYIRPQPVVLDLGTDDPREALEALVRPLGEQGLIADPDAVTDALFERETAHTTAMGNGVAIPHATIQGLDRPLILLAVVTGGTRFGPEAMEPIRLFFLLLSPPGAAGLHIKLLARIARLVRDPAVIEELTAADSSQSLLEAIERADAAHV